MTAEPAAKYPNLAAHCWQPGQSGNPVGRPVGSRNRLGEKFLEDLHRDWREHGAKAIEAVRQNDPGTYLRVVASLVPRQMQLNVGLGDQLAALLEGMQRQPIDVTPP